MTLGEVTSASLHDEDAAEPGAAGVAFGAAIELCGELGHEALLARARFMLGRYKAEIGEHAAAKDVLRDSLMMFSKLGLERQASEVERLLASMN